MAVPALKTFECTNCGTQARRVTAPLSCDKCGQKRIGLFKVAADQPAKPAAPEGPAPQSTVPVAKPVAPSPTATRRAAAPQPEKTPAAPADRPAARPSPPPAARPTPRPQRDAENPPAQSPSPSEATKEPAARPAAKPAARPQPAEKPAAKPAARPQPAEKPAAKPAARPQPAEKPAARPAETKRTPVSASSSSAPQRNDVVWSFPPQIPGQDFSTTPLRNSVVMGAEATAYAAIGNRVFAIREVERQPQVVWSYDAGGHIPGSPVVGKDGRIRVHSANGKLHCLSADGQPTWSPADVGEPLGWASPIVDEDGHTYICNYAGGLTKVSNQGIRGTRPYFRSRQKLDSTGLIHNGVLFVGGEDGFVHAIRMNESQGEPLWDPLADQGKTDWFINSSPAIAPGGLIVVAGRDEHLYAFDAQGETKFKVHIRGQMLASPVIDAAGNIYVGVSLIRRNAEHVGRLVCVDAQSARVKWQYEASGPIESTPVIGDDGFVYFGDNEGGVHAVDSEGKRIWRKKVGIPVRSAGTIPFPRRLLFGSDNGTLIALECSSETVHAQGWPKYMGPIDVPVDK